MTKIGKPIEITAVDGEAGLSLLEVAFAKDSKLLVTCADEQRLRVWKLPSGEHLRDLECEPATDSITGMGVSADGSVAVTGSLGHLAAWDIVSGERVNWYVGDFAGEFIVWAPEHFAAMPDGKGFFTDHEFSEIAVWDAGVEEPRMSTDFFHEEAIKDIEISPDGKTMVTADAEKRLVAFALVPDKDA